ncbi:MAG: hypothetical protein HZB57_13105 [Gammaproteobacteria bacterium]|nr:hypothetical protein [Gammaproteobacteria bacterium]
MAAWVDGVSPTVLHKTQAHQLMRDAGGTPGVLIAIIRLQLRLDEGHPREVAIATDCIEKMQLIVVETSDVLITERYPATREEQGFPNVFSALQIFLAVALEESTQGWIAGQCGAFLQHPP